MKPLTIPIPLESLTPEMLAEAFWAMDSDQQAKFFGQRIIVNQHFRVLYGYGLKF